jgi:hypothetical protein
VLTDINFYSLRFLNTKNLVGSKKCSIFAAVLETI